MLPKEIFKIRTLKLARMNFKFPDLWNFVANSLTFKSLFQIPLIFQVFQVSGQPVQSFGEKSGQGQGNSRKSYGIFVPKTQGNHFTFLKQLFFRPILF